MTEIDLHAMRSRLDYARDVAGTSRDGATVQQRVRRDLGVLLDAFAPVDDGQEVMVVAVDGDQLGALLAQHRALTATVDALRERVSGLEGEQRRDERAAVRYRRGARRALTIHCAHIARLRAVLDLAGDTIVAQRARAAETRAEEAAPSVVLAASA